MSGEVPQMQLFFPGSRAVHYWPHLSDKNFLLFTCLVMMERMNLFYRRVPIASPAIPRRPREGEKERGEVEVRSRHLGQVDRSR